MPPAAPPSRVARSELMMLAQRLSVREAAAMLRLRVSVVRAACTSGELPCEVRTGDKGAERYYIRIQDADDWAKKTWGKASEPAPTPKPSRARRGKAATRYA